MPTTENVNLDAHRISQRVWDKRGWQGLTTEEQLAPWLVSLGGAGMLAFGASRRSWRGAPFMLIGAGLMALAATGACSPRSTTGAWRRWLPRAESADLVGTESMDSFPASDAPSSNATAAVGLRE